MPGRRRAGDRPIGAGISFTPGASSGAKYAARANMGDKPVNYVSWFDAARVANWLHNGQAAGLTGNFATYNRPDWNGSGSLDPPGNVTTVGTNGGPSAYGAYDMNGNVWELTSAAGGGFSSLTIRGGSWLDNNGTGLSSSPFGPYDITTELYNVGFRLAAVPQPAAFAMALTGLACGFLMSRRRGLRLRGRDR